MRGDWAVRRPDLPTGGFPFEFANDNYPDVDDTAVVVLALRRAGGGDARAADRGLAWALGMQTDGGGWGAFDADNTSELPLRLPFCDFGAVTDPPSADVTAHMVELLGYEGRASEPATRAGLDYLLREQERDGSWFGRWGANHVYGTGAVVPALAACGHARPPEPCARATGWLERGAERGRRLRRGPALLPRPRLARPRRVDRVADGVGAARLPRRRRRTAPAVERAVRWLVETQRPDGGWDEPYYTGTGFPGDFYFNYHLYRRRVPGDGARARARSAATDAICSLLAPLRVEQAMLRHPDARLLHTGMGPERARVAAARALAIDAGARRDRRRVRGRRRRCRAPATSSAPTSCGARTPSRSRCRPPPRSRICCTRAGSACTSGRCCRSTTSRSRPSATSSPAATRWPSTWSRRGSRPARPIVRSRSCASSRTPPAATSATRAWRSTERARSPRCGS